MVVLVLAFLCFLFKITFWGGWRFGSVFRCLPNTVRVWVQSLPEKSKTSSHLWVVGSPHTLSSDPNTVTLETGVWNMGTLEVGLGVILGCNCPPSPTPWPLWHFLFWVLRTIMVLFYLHLKYSCIWNLDFWPLLDFRIYMIVDLCPAPNKWF